MKRVLLLNNVPAPYFDPLFERLGSDSGWDLTVCYSSNWNRDVAWEEKQTSRAASHRTIILDRINPRLKRHVGSSMAAAAALIGILKREKPDYLICYGYTLKPQLAALIWAMVTGSAFALIGDANIHNDAIKGMKRLLKGFWLRLIVARSAALITIGTANRMFWESYGARPDRLFEARFAVDNDYFARACRQQRAEAAELSDKLGLGGRVVFLYAGRLVRRKNVDLIIRGFKLLNDDRAALIIAGDGIERSALESAAGGDRRIIFAGRIEPGQLPLYYALSDVLVLVASQEPWGLVVNEAMASGLAVIGHKDCGATVDLVGNDNGYALQAFSAEELAGAMEKIVADDRLRSAMQQRSLEKIASWSIEGAARGIICAVNASFAAGDGRFVSAELRKER